jgi:hypothetical protein
VKASLVETTEEITKGVPGVADAIVNVFEEVSTLLVTLDILLMAALIS